MGHRICIVKYTSTVDGSRKILMETRVVMEDGESPQKVAEDLLVLYNQPPYKSKTRKCVLKSVGW